MVQHHCHAQRNEPAGAVYQRDWARQTVGREGMDRQKRGSPKRKSPHCHHDFGCHHGCGICGDDGLVDSGLIYSVSSVMVLIAIGAMKWRTIGCPWFLIMMDSHSSCLGNARPNTERALFFNLRDRGTSLSNCG
ncbi:hypothetical protein L3X38_022343 [Prunus dulcis]|uniref:Uncharacterized protein n=1 Tax=Prunus dulcis TaxID=3755 RepID=A0AAD4Z4H9_PRUDU|nr:hypothetical protein L3X38_022343 [Prunus dulcis]